MRNWKIAGDLSAKLRGINPAVWIFTIPIMGFVLLFFLRYPATERPEGGNEPVTKKGTVAERNAPPAGADRDVAALEPLRPKIIRAKPEEKTPSVCPVSDPASGLVTVAEEETPILLAPSPTAKPLRDWNGAQRLLDPRHDLRVLENSGAWVRVSVVSPNWPPGNVGWSGWVERKSIQPSDAPDAKNCLFLDPAKWPNLPAAVQSAARSAALQILRQDDRCRRISRGGYLGNGQRFYLTCYPGDGGKPYHYWLSATNTRKNFTAPAPLDEDAAMLKCRGALQKELSNLARIEGREPEEATIETFEARRSGAVHQLSLDFRAQTEDMQKAHCLVAPGGGAEIILGNPS